MSRLVVVARSEDTIAKPGNRRPCYIVVSVTNENGVPVATLTKKNFAVDALIVGPGGALVNISSTSKGRLPGFYILRVVPIRKETWKKGVYIFGVAVTNKKDKGQSLARVRMD